MEMDQNQQEIMYKLSIFEQQIQQLQQQLQAVEQGIVEMSSLNLGLNDLKGAKDKEILTSIGKGIFAKTKLLSEELIVDIGERKFVKKTIPKTQELIDTQIEKLEEIKKELSKNLEKVNEELIKTFKEVQEKEK
ncbi:MAG: prefoldin subunit alpha [Nanoarchaeota archaeon]|nr:prefoldin subunit alpha [Nanoarchaeota archaeon]MBU1028288.1 prefoldin subunit alpha [Nanoarchaeota archaeon]